MAIHPGGLTVTVILIAKGPGYPGFTVLLLMAGDRLSGGRSNAEHWTEKMG